MPTTKQPPRILRKDRMLPPTALPGKFIRPRFLARNLVAVIINSGPKYHTVVPYSLVRSQIVVDLHTGSWRPRFRDEAMGRPIKADISLNYPHQHLRMRERDRLDIIFPDGPTGKTRRDPGYYYLKDCRVKIGKGLISVALWGLLDPDIASHDYPILGIYDRSKLDHLSQMIEDCAEQLE